MADLKMSSKSYSKDDLRRLMQEKKQEQLSNKKIESPFAAYDQDGDLFCNICNLKIDNVNFWTKHLVSKEHKSSLERIKKGQNLNQLNEQLNENKKRKLKDVETNNAKQQKTESIKEVAKGIEKEATKEIKDHLRDNNQLVGDLPKGFFDSPEEDAKARDEIYKDPLEDEWSKFQRSMQEEQKVVENIVESDLIETQNYRELVEVNEQIEHWNRINKLEIKRDELKKSNKKIEIDCKQDSNDSDEISENDLEDEFNILSNWRCKKTS